MTGEFGLFWSDQDSDKQRAVVNTGMNFRVRKMRGIAWLAAEEGS